MHSAKIHPTYFDNVQNIVILSRKLAKEGMTFCQMGILKKAP